MTERSCGASYPSRPARAACCGLLLLLAGGAGASDSRLVVESGPGRAGPLAWGAASLSWRPAGPQGPGAWQASVDGFEGPGWQGSLLLDCERGGLRNGRPWCEEGRFETISQAGGTSLGGRLFQPGDAGALGMRLADGGLELLIHWPRGSQALSAEAELDGFELSQLPRSLIEGAGLSVLGGRVDGRLRWRDGRLSGDLAAAELGFDRPDGRVAAADVAASLDVELGPFEAGSGWPFSVSLSQNAGEVLAGPVYLPPPETPLALSARGRYAPGAGLEVDAFELEDGEAVTASGRLRLSTDGQVWALQSVGIESFDVRLPDAWARWGEGLAGGYGLGGLETAGRIGGELDWAADRAASLRIETEGLSATDARGRFAVENVSGELRREGNNGRVRLDWSALELFRLAFGAASLRATGEAGVWRLAQALELPLLDGAVVFDRLAVHESSGEAPSLALDARIDPLDLAALTRMLGLPEFGGSLSGQFPGVELEGDRLAFTGGIDVEAFSGHIALSDLVIERPFGSLPALAAQVELERLDLEALTGAFNFGHMEGELSGWIRGLRLLDWQPVAMDARVFTHEDAPRRRIGQRAVENLSRLGGGAAALSAPLLGLFEEFPYRRAGLACRLGRNICHMDGVAAHEGGGFYIVQGRGLPRLDVIGHRRLVDWPRVVAQLTAIARQE